MLATSGGAVAQSVPSGPSLRVADLADAQRQALEAEMRRTLARARMPDQGAGPSIGAATVPALGAAASTLSAVAPIAMAVPTAGRAVDAPLHASAERFSLLGIARVRGHWLAEIDAGNGTRLVRAGDPVHGGWTVTSVEAGRVLLEGPLVPGRGKKAKPTAMTRTLTLGL